MLKVDYNFFYKNIVRSLLIYKLNNVINTHSVPSIMKLLFFFPITRIEDINHVQGYNYAYLFRFFFGKRAFLTRQRSFFNLGKWTYSFNVSIILQKPFVYPQVFVLVNDLLPRVDRSFLNYGVFSKSSKVFYFIIKDLNVFSEKKTNLGLFFLESNLNFHIFCNGIDLHGTKLLLRNLKINFF